MLAAVALCVFCGERGSSEEDVFARWIAEVVGGGPFSLRRDHGRSKSNLTTLRLTSRAPCRACNNTWMNLMEEAARPFLTPVLLDTPTRWTTLAQQRAVAQWAFKTALMIDRSGRPERQNAPAEHFKRFFDTKLPPPGARIDLARYAPDPGEEYLAAFADLSWYGLGGAPRRRETKGYRITFSVGHVIFQVFGSMASDLPSQAIRRTVWGEPGVILEDVFRQLWPLTFEVHEWPPSGPPFSTASLDVLRGNKPS
jgi:hypothetical protein